MKGFLFRIIYAAVFVVMFWLVFPMFLSIIGLPLTGQVMELLHLVIACLAVAYVLFAREAQTPSLW